MTLKDEMTGDPLGRGYNEEGSEDPRPTPMSDKELTNSLNEVNRERDRTHMSGDEISATIDEKEYLALSDIKKTRLLWLLNKDSVNPFDFAETTLKDLFARSLLPTLFGAVSPTLIAFASARIEIISRATEIGLGKIKVGHVEEARRPPRELGVTCEFDDDKAMRHSIATRLGTTLCDRHRALIADTTTYRAKVKANGLATALIPADILAEVYADVQAGKL